jgi:MFS family permease
MLYPILPLFLTETLGASAGIVGLIDGVAQALQHVVQGLSGWLSDRLRRYRAIGLSLAADLLPAELRASGIGWFNASVGLSALGASVIGGELWTRIDPRAAFVWGAFFALLGSIALAIFVADDRGPAAAR